MWIKSEIVKCQIWLNPTSTHPLFNHPNIKTKLSRLNVGGFNRKYFNLIIPHGPWHGATVQKAPFLHNMWTVPYIIYGFVQCCMCTKDGILSPVVSVYIRIYPYISVYISEYIRIYPYISVYIRIYLYISVYNMWRGVVCTRWNLITGCIRDKALRSTIAHLPAVTCSNHSSDKLINQNKCYGKHTSYVSFFLHGH